MQLRAHGRPLWKWVSLLPLLKVPLPLFEGFPRGIVLQLFLERLLSALLGFLSRLFVGGLLFLQLLLELFLKLFVLYLEQLLLVLLGLLALLAFFLQGFDLLLLRLLCRALGSLRQQPVLLFLVLQFRTEHDGGFPSFGVRADRNSGYGAERFALSLLKYLVDSIDPGLEVLRIQPRYQVGNRGQMVEDLWRSGEGSELHDGGREYVDGHLHTRLAVIVENGDDHIDLANTFGRAGDRGRIRIERHSSGQLAVEPVDRFVARAECDIGINRVNADYRVDSRRSGHFENCDIHGDAGRVALATPELEDHVDEVRAPLSRSGNCDGA